MPRCVITKPDPLPPSRRPAILRNLDRISSKATNSRLPKKGVNKVFSVSREKCWKCFGITGLFRCGTVSMRRPPGLSRWLRASTKSAVCDGGICSRTSISVTTSNRICTGSVKISWVLNSRWGLNALANPIARSELSIPSNSASGHR